MTLDASDHVIEANQDAAQLLGFPKKDIINRRFSIFVKDYDRAAFRAFFNEILVNQQREIRELRLSTPSGDIVAQLSGISTRGKKKALTHVRIAILDITRLREAETRARPSEEMYRELFESVLEGIAIVDENEIIQMCNPALAKIYDADKPAELVGRNVLDFSPGPEGQVILGQTALRKQNISSKYELGIVTLKGRRKTIRVSATPWFDEKGKYRGSLGNIIDITERKAMERELAKGRQRLELALYGGGLGLWDWNLVSGEVESNELWAEMLGYTLDELRPITSKTWEDLLNPEDKERTLTALQDYIEGKTDSYDCEFRLRAKDGHWVWILDRGKITERDSDGKSLRVTGTHLDISARKEMEVALRDSNEKYQTLVEMSPHTIVIFQDHKVAFANQATARLLGYERAEDIIGLDVLAPVPPEDAKRLEGYLEKHLLHPGSASDSFIFKGTRRDGGTFSAEVFITGISFKGRPAAQLMAIDITEKEKNQEALRESEARFHELFNHSLNGMALFEITAQNGQPSDAKFLAVNPQFEKLAARKSEAIVGRFLSGLAPEILNMDLFKIACQVAYGEKESHFGEYTAEKSSRIFDVKIYSPQRGQVAADVMDVTDKRKAENDLKTVNAELKQFAYVASHDLQEPLRMIASYLQLIEKRYKNKLDHDADEFIEFAVEGAKRLQRMIISLLEYSRVDTRGQEFRSVDCNKVLEEAKSNLQLAIEDEAAEIVADKLPTVVGDYLQLTRLFQNLISNSIKFRRAEERPRVHISARRLDGEWEFAFRDNGIGIDPRHHERIFVIFQRLHGLKYPGTGIGLSVAKKIVERHGGRIWVESEDGRGATFYFTLSALGQKGAGESAKTGAASEESKA